eukprot:2713567-Prymnesium_polylepis.1
MHKQGAWRAPPPPAPSVRSRDAAAGSHPGHSAATPRTAAAHTRRRRPTPMRLVLRPKAGQDLALLIRDVSETVSLGRDEVNAAELRLSTEHMRFSPVTSDGVPSIRVEATGTNGMRVRRDGRLLTRLDKS